MAQPFEKDLGYLDRFLEKVRAHASALTDRSQGERLASLIDGEVTRWQEIRGLLAGEDAASRRTEEAGPAAPPAEEAHAVASGPSPEEVRTREAQQGRRWTVGPLRPG